MTHTPLRAILVRLSLVVGVIAVASQAPAAAIVQSVSGSGLAIAQSYSETTGMFDGFPDFKQGPSGGVFSQSFGAFSQGAWLVSAGGEGGTVATRSAARWLENPRDAVSLEVFARAVYSFTTPTLVNYLAVAEMPQDGEGIAFTNAHIGSFGSFAGMSAPAVQSQAGSFLMPAGGSLNARGIGNVALGNTSSDPFEGTVSGRSAVVWAFDRPLRGQLPDDPVFWGNFDDILDDDDMGAIPGDILASRLVAAEPVASNHGVADPVFFGGVQTSTPPLAMFTASGTGAEEPTVEGYYFAADGPGVTSFSTPAGIPGDTSLLMIDVAGVRTPYDPSQPFVFPEPVQGFSLIGLDPLATAPLGQPAPFVVGAQFEHEGIVFFSQAPLGNLIPEPHACAICLLSALAPMSTRRPVGR